MTANGQEARLRIELGRQWMSARQIAGLAPGSVIELACDGASPVEVFAGGKRAACGELVAVEGKLAVRVRHLKTVEADAALEPISFGLARACEPVPAQPGKAVPPAY